MNRRAARILTRLYPQVWRTRFGDEFQTFLENRQVGMAEVLDVAWSAVAERLSSALPLAGYACLATAAAVGAAYLAIDKHPAQAVAAHRVLWFGWIAMEVYALLTIATAAATVRRLKDWQRPAGMWMGLLIPLCAAIFLSTHPSDRRLTGLTLILLGVCFRGAVSYLKAVFKYSEVSGGLTRRQELSLAVASLIIAPALAAAGWSLIFVSLFSSLPYWGLLCALGLEVNRNIQVVRRLLTDPVEAA